MSDWVIAETVNSASAPGLSSIIIRHYFALWKWGRGALKMRGDCVENDGSNSRPTSKKDGSATKSGRHTTVSCLGPDPFSSQAIFPSFSALNFLSPKTPANALGIYLWPFDLESGVRVIYDLGYLCANFSLPRPLCSRLRPDVCDRQTSDVRQDVRRATSLNAPTLGAGA